MDTSSFWEYIGDISIELNTLRHELSGSESNPSQMILSRLVKNEGSWIKLFKAANIAYFPVGFTSTAQALAQLNVLYETVVRFKRQFVGKLFANMRNILADTDITSAVVQTPTFHIDTLIDAGKLSGSGSVYNAATGLEDALSKVTLGFPASSFAVRPSKAYELTDGWGAYVETLRPACKLITPDARVLGALVPRSEYTYPAISGNGDTDVQTGNATPVSFGTGLARPASHNIAVILVNGNVSGFVERVESGTMAWTEGLSLGLTSGNTYAIVAEVTPVGSMYGFNFAGTADDAAVFAVGDTMRIWTADGVDAVGATAWVRGSTEVGWVQHQFTFVATGTERLVTECVADAGFTVYIAEVNDPGEIRASVDGIALPTPVSNARFRDLIGGGNIDDNLKLLNVQRFTEILAVAHAFQAGYADTSVYNVMNLHYQNHAITSADSAVSLNSFVTDPLKSVKFWFGLTSEVGVSKYTRIALWRVYYPMICDMLTMARIDGKVPYFLEN
jgi:hypothetical protein